jgi:hypothetical protein
MGRECSHYENSGAGWQAGVGSDGKGGQKQPAACLTALAASSIACTPYTSVSSRNTRQMLSAFVIVALMTRWYAFSPHSPCHLPVIILKRRPVAPVLIRMTPVRSPRCLVPPAPHEVVAAERHMTRNPRVRSNTPPKHPGTYLGAHAGQAAQRRPAPEPAPVAGRERRGSGWRIYRRGAGGRSAYLLPVWQPRIRFPCTLT